LKKVFTAIAIIFAFCFAFTIGCSKKNTNITINAADKIYVIAGDTLDGHVSASDDKGDAVAVTVNNDGGFDSKTPGVYNVEFKAEKDGVTATRTVTVEVVGLNIDFPEAFVVGTKISLEKPSVTTTQTNYEVSVSFKVGDIDFKNIEFIDNVADLTFESEGTYTIRASVTLDGTTLKKDITSEGVTATTDDSEFVAIVGEEFTAPTVSFSDNVDGAATVSFRKFDEGDFTVAKNGKIVFPEVGYYEVGYTVNVNGKSLDYIHEVYARKSATVMDFEGTDGTHFGMADRQWKDNGAGAAMLEVSDFWSHDGRYSLKQTSGAFWAGMIYNRSLELGSAVDTMVCYIYSEEEFTNTSFCIYTDENNYAIATFTVKKGEHKYFLKFDKSFDRIREFRTQSERSTFYIDSVEFGNYDVGNVLSLGEVTINGSALGEGETLTLPIPTATSSIYSAEQLAGGTLRLFVSRDGESETEIEKNANGEFTMTATGGTYRFRYEFTVDGSVAERIVTGNIAKYDVEFSVVEKANIGDAVEIADISGGEDGDEITVTVTTPGGDEIAVTKRGGKYTFIPKEVGYYEVYVRIQGTGKWGESTSTLYARESDMALDFEGVNEHRGYVNSYTEPNKTGYVPVTDAWSYDGKYSTYFNVATNGFWYGFADINLAVPAGSSSVTFVINAAADYTQPVVWWVDTDAVSTYAEGFMIKAGVHSYTVRIGADGSGNFIGLKSFGMIKQFAFQPNAADLNKPFYLDAVVFHPYTEFDVEIAKPNIKLNEEYTFVRPEITSDYLTSEEIAAIEMIVEIEKDGEKEVLAPTDGALKLTLTKSGIYNVTVTLKNKYAKKTATFSYAFGTIAIDATIDGNFTTGKDYTFEMPTITSDGDITGATVKISYAKKGSDVFTEMKKNLGKYVFNVNAAGKYVIRYEVTAGDIKGMRDYEISVCQAGVFIDYESDGRGGWVDTYYGTSHFLPELSNEWAYDGTHSVKVNFRSDAWYGFNYANGLYVVPQGTDKISVWIKSDRTFTYPSFIAFSAYSTEKKDYVWYYMDEFIIEKGVNLYEGRIRLYGNLESYVKFTPALAGSIRAFTFHTENCNDGSPDFDSTVYFDSIRFSDTETANFNDLTVLPAVKGQEYTFSYASPSGFVDENLVIAYRKPGESEWVTIYSSDAYDGEDITYTFDFTGKADIRIIAVYGELFATWRGTLTISG
jgi:hypothetical protein